MRVDLQTTLLGPLSAREIGVALILVATVIGWNVGPALGLNSTVVGVLSVIAATLVGCFGKKALQGLNWDFLLGYGVILAISRLTVSLGIGDAIAAAIQQLLGGTVLAPPLFLLAVAALNLALRVVLPLDQALLLLTISLAPAAQAMGIDPWIVAITVLATGSVWFFPSHNYAYIVADEAAERRLFTPTHARAACLGYAVAAVAGLPRSPGSPSRCRTGICWA
jgi:di/tricarboxylate transporter